MAAFYTFPDILSKISVNIILLEIMDDKQALVLNNGLSPILYNNALSNPLWPSDTVQVITCCWFSTKPLSQPMNDDPVYWCLYTYTLRPGDEYKHR